MIKILLHFMACYLVADVTYNFIPKTIGSDAYWGPLIPMLLATGVACLVGIGKELWDKYHDKETISAGDLTVDFTGALVWFFIPKIAELLPYLN